MKTIMRNEDGPVVAVDGNLSRQRKVHPAGVASPGASRQYGWPSTCIEWSERRLFAPGMDDQLRD
jgi:hypothetical protein